jgi:hypothetical protein
MVRAAENEEGVLSVKEEGVLSGKEEGVLSRKEEGVLSGKEEGVLSGKEEGVLSGKEEGVLSRKERALQKFSAAMSSNVHRMRSVDLFRGLDLDRSGKVSRKEFQAGLKRVGLGIWSDQDVGELLVLFDTDGDGEISMRELKKGLEKTYAQQCEEQPAGSSEKKRGQDEEMNTSKTIEAQQKEQQAQQAQQAQEQQAQQEQQEQEQQEQQHRLQQKEEEEGQGEDTQGEKPLEERVQEPAGETRLTAENLTKLTEENYEQDWGKEEEKEEEEKEEEELGTAASNGAGAGFGGGGGGGAGAGGGASASASAAAGRIDVPPAAAGAASSSEGGGETKRRKWSALRAMVRNEDGALDFHERMRRLEQAGSSDSDTDTETDSESDVEQGGEAAGQGQQKEGEWEGGQQAVELRVRKKGQVLVHLRDRTKLAEAALSPTVESEVLSMEGIATAPAFTHTGVSNDIVDLGAAVLRMLDGGSDDDEAQHGVGAVATAAGGGIGGIAADTKAEGAAGAGGRSSVGVVEDEDHGDVSDDDDLHSSRTARRASPGGGRVAAAAPAISAPVLAPPVAAPPAPPAAPAADACADKDVSSDVGDGWGWDNTFGTANDDLDDFGASFRKWSDSLVLDDVFTNGSGVGTEEGGVASGDPNASATGFGAGFVGTSASGKTSGYSSVAIDSPSTAADPLNRSTSSTSALLSPMSPEEIQQEVANQVKRVAGEHLAQLVQAQVQAQILAQAEQAEQAARERERSTSEHEMKREIGEKTSEAEALRRRIADLEQQQQHDLQTFQQRLLVLGGKLQTRTPLAGPPTPAELGGVDAVLGFGAIEGSLQPQNASGYGTRDDAGRGGDRFEEVDLTSNDTRGGGGGGGQRRRQSGRDDPPQSSTKEKIMSCTGAALDKIERCTSMTIKKLKQCVTKEGTHANRGGGRGAGGNNQSPGAGGGRERGGANRW